ncbi:divergent PAP2 family protein [Patescibacteria group bacterium]|nr:divergent PAP2 family protein [Patescibacteria group bacterium]
MIIEYQFIVLPLIAVICAQLLKLAINGIRGKFSWKDLVSYGGMPSSHTAFVTALAAIVGYFEGWNSPIFAIAFIFGIIVVRDAGGYRRMMGKQAKTLNSIIQQIPAELSCQFPHLDERIGHTPKQLFFGSLIGLLTIVIYILIIS